MLPANEDKDLFGESIKPAAPPSHNQDQGLTLNDDEWEQIESAWSDEAVQARNEKFHASRKARVDPPST